MRVQRQQEAEQARGNTRGASSSSMVSFRFFDSFRINSTWLLQNKGIDPLEIWERCKRGGPPSPLEQLAEIILAICPNTGSVERFFSLLKLILTSTRANLSSENLSILARLNTHIRHEWKNDGTLTKHLEWQQRHYIDISVTASTSVQSPTASTAMVPDNSAPGDPISNPMPPSQLPETSPGDNTEVDKLAAAAEQAATLTHVRSLNTIARDLIQAAERDAGPQIPPPAVPHGAPILFGRPYSLPLARMFDYGQTY